MTCAVLVLVAADLFLSLLSFLYSGSNTVASCNIMWSSLQSASIIRLEVYSFQVLILEYGRGFDLANAWHIRATRKADCIWTNLLQITERALVWFSNLSIGGLPHLCIKSLVNSATDTCTKKAQSVCHFHCASVSKKVQWDDEATERSILVVIESTFSFWALP